MLLSMPSHRGQPIVLAPGAEVVVRFILGGAVFQFKTLYRESRHFPLPVWVVGPAYEVSKIQRRSYFRLETYLPVILHVEKEAEPEKSVPPIVDLNLQTKDISGGGLRVVSKTLFEPGTEVMVELTLPGKVKIPTKGRVVRSEPSAPDSRIHWVSIEFTFIEEHDRKKIVTFVFQKQLSQR